PMDSEMPGPCLCLANLIGPLNMISSRTPTSERLPVEFSGASVWVWSFFPVGFDGDCSRESHATRMSKLSGYDKAAGFKAERYDDRIPRCVELVRQLA